MWRLWVGGEALITCFKNFSFYLSSMKFKKQKTKVLGVFFFFVMSTQISACWDNWIRYYSIKFTHKWHGEFSYKPKHLFLFSCSESRGYWVLGLPVMLATQFEFPKTGWSLWKPWLYTYICQGEESQWETMFTCCFLVHNSYCWIPEKIRLGPLHKLSWFYQGECLVFPLLHLLREVLNQLKYGIEVVETS